MPTRSSKLDLNQLAKRILDEATGDEPKTEPPPVKNEAAVALGKLGGKKGGAARAAASRKVTEYAHGGFRSGWHAGRYVLGPACGGECLL